MNIQAFLSKVKTLGERLNSRELYTVLLILLAGFGSFGLGRLSKLQEVRLPIKVEQTISAQAASAFSSPSPFQGGDGVVVANVKGQLSPVTGSIAPGGGFVASKGGTKYHFPWCSGAQRISAANKIWFNSVEEARKAGYTPASNCKGLK